MKNIYLTQARIWIDNVETTVNVIMPFYQRDPYPGNHKYKLELFFQKEQDAQKVFEFNKLGNPQNSASDTFFLSLTSLLEDTRKSGTILYLLNTIDQTEINRNIITLAGIASDLIRSPVLSGENN